MRISDWSSDVCSSDLFHPQHHRRRLAPVASGAIPFDIECDLDLGRATGQPAHARKGEIFADVACDQPSRAGYEPPERERRIAGTRSQPPLAGKDAVHLGLERTRSDEHTTERHTQMRSTLHT